MNKYMYIRKIIIEYPIRYQHKTYKLDLHKIYHVEDTMPQTAAALFLVFDLSMSETILEMIELS